MMFGHLRKKLTLTTLHQQTIKKIFTLITLTSASLSYKETPVQSVDNDFDVNYEWLYYAMMELKDNVTQTVTCNKLKSAIPAHYTNLNISQLNN